jgi:hypothetical protein
MRADSVQRTARAAGLLYLLQMAAGVFGFWAKGQVTTPDAAETARNLVGSERLFRLGLASDLTTCVLVIALTVALYAILSPVHPTLARLAAFWRLAENAVAAASTLGGFVALQLVGSAAYLGGVDPGTLQGLARALIGAHGSGLQVAFVFLGLGSALFSWLWWRSRYVPRLLAGLGIFASLTLGLVTLMVLVFPPLGRTLGLLYMAPMGVYEIGLGLWLLIKGVRAAPGRAD